MLSSRVFNIVFVVEIAVSSKDGSKMFKCSKHINSESDDICGYKSTVDIVAVQKPR